MLLLFATDGETPALAPMISLKPKDPRGEPAGFCRVLLVPVSEKQNDPPGKPLPLELLARDSLPYSLLHSLPYSLLRA